MFKLYEASRALVFLTILVWPVVAKAASVPDAARVLGESKEALVTPLLPRVVQPQASELTPVDLGDDGFLVLRGVRFTGNELIEAELLTQSLLGYLYEKVDLDDLYSLAARISQVYAQQGYLATTRLLQQDVTDGIITFTVVEARFGDTSVEYAEQSSNRMQKGVVESIAELQAPMGEPVKFADVDRTLLLANDLSGFDVQGGLVPGEDNKESSLALKVAQTKLVSGSMTLDNQGSRATGVERLMLSAQAASPTGVGDNLSANALLTEGVKYIGISYSLPIGSDGLTYTLDASSTDYRIVEADDAAQKSTGGSASFGASLRYPFIRSRSQNLYGTASINRSNLTSTDSSDVKSKYRVDSASFGLYGNQWDQHFNAGSTSYNIDLTTGYVDMDKNSDKYSSDQLGAKTAGNFTKLSLGAERSETIDDLTSITLSVDGQLASKNLDSGQKFYLGGPNGVRAYPNSEGGGSEGVSATLELERRLNSLVTGIVFYDWGLIRQYKFNDVTAADPNIFTLQGLGVGLKGQISTKFNWSATLARRTNNNPNPTTDGNDQDGTKTENRLWLSVSAPF